MCGICGCDAPQAHEHDHQHHHGHGHDGGHDHEHVLADGTVIRHSHGHDHAPAAAVETLNFAGRGAPVSDGARLLTVQRDILEKNDSFARFNRTVFDARGVLALNLVSSPGSGKTTLLVETLKRLQGRLSAAVIEGDQATDLDGARIRQTGAPAIQVNTGKACHLDARMVGEAAARLDPQAGSVLFIENVGNLVCPAGFDLGERSKIVLASVTEGEDKPLKYPDIFAASDLALITKIDLAGVLDFDTQALIDNARKVNPRLAVLCVSARTGAGLEEWIGWIEARLSGRAAAEAAE